LEQRSERISYSKPHWQAVEIQCGFGFEVPNADATKIAGTSNPPHWPLTEISRRRKKLLAEGFDGIIYPSFMSPGGMCVALWRWNGPGEPSLRVVDPEGRLPKSVASWV
jgi:RES domain-containing protein